MLAADLLELELAPCCPNSIGFPIRFPITCCSFWLTHGSYSKREGSPMSGWPSVRSALCMPLRMKAADTPAGG